MINYLSDALRKSAKIVLSHPVWEDKCWGKVWHRFNDNIINESLLQVKKGWQCSIHYHINRYNAFISSSSVRCIEVWDKKHNSTIIELAKTDKDPSNEISPKICHILRQGECYVVPPMTFHRFYVIEDGQVIEIYWTDDNQPCHMMDIYRVTVGGLR